METELQKWKWKSGAGKSRCRLAQQIKGVVETRNYLIGCMLFDEKNDPGRVNEEIATSDVSGYSSWCFGRHLSNPFLLNSTFSSPPIGFMEAIQNLSKKFAHFCLFSWRVSSKTIQYPLGIGAPLGAHKDLYKNQIFLKLFKKIKFWSEIVCLRRCHIKHFFWKRFFFCVCK